MSRLIKCPNRHFYDADKWERCPICNNQGMAEIAAKTEPQFSDFIDDDATVSIFSSGKKEICGWLVCISGFHKGKDYKIVDGKNMVGRSHLMQICIHNDEDVSVSNHCAIIFDNRREEFWLTIGNGTMTYLNGELLTNQSRLYTDDRITIGNSTFIFIAFCDGERSWKNF